MEKIDKPLIELLVLLVTKVKKDPFEQLAEECRPLLIHLMKKYYIKGFEYQDYWQEANRALFEAVKGFDPNKGIEFTTYLSRVVMNHFNDLIRYTHSKRRIGEEQVLFLEDMTQAKEHNVYLMGEGANPEDLYLAKEALQENITLLSDFESQVLAARLNNNSYDQIAKKLDCTKSQAQQALYRCKVKLSNM
jgi:RNA polymerase sporulation-specific sigma factor